MRFSCHFDYFPTKWIPELLVNPMTFEVRCFDDLGNDCVVARLAIEHLDLTKVALTGRPLHDACDINASKWLPLQEALFEPKSSGELRRDFRLDDSVRSVLFLHRSMFHREIHEWRMFILDHVAGLSGRHSALVMRRKETGLALADLARLGFRRIAGHDVLFRPSTIVSEYDPAEDARTVFNLVLDHRTDIEVEDQWGA